MPCRLMRPHPPQAYVPTCWINTAWKNQSAGATWWDWPIEVWCGCRVFRQICFSTSWGSAFHRVARSRPIQNNWSISEVGAQCLEQLAELANLMPDEIFRMNPIALYEQMAAEDSIAYCPFAYTYSNYSRDGFGTRRVRFSNPVALDGNVPIRTVLGGTGLAISKGCKETSVALEYGLFVAGSTCQRTLYAVSGGQPARKSAWSDPLVNQITDDFFVRTTASIETSYVRPRYAGYVGLQERAGEIITHFAVRHRNPQKALEQIDALYRLSLRDGVHHV
jgi:multiple sugar transport system substrate-binding protein